MFACNRFRLALTAGVLGLAVAVLTGSAVRGDENDKTGTGTESKTIKLEGTGRQASKKFTLEPGLTVFEINHDGNSNVIVRLLDQDGNAIDTLFNQIGQFNGERGFAIHDGGKFLLDIVADGKWNININQPRPTTGESAPRSLIGTGVGITEFVELNKGLNVFKFNHAGKGRFTAKLMDRDGKLVENLINTLGSFNGSKPVTIEKRGIYFLNVGGDGNWTVDVE